ncbi:MAG: formylglycine-generating enzyme family protein [Desulfobulbus sp.]|nr:formylglycine-generating enzyme family protein [Desulfobulbus sp.]
MNGRAEHGMVGRADLLRILQTVPPEQFMAMARMLGFALKENEPVQPPPSVDAPTLEVMEEPVFQPEPSLPASENQGNGPAYYRITDHQGVETTPDEPGADFPQWFLDAQPTFLEEAITHIPPLHRQKPEVHPLLPWSRLWPFLHRVLGGELEGKQPDLDQLTRRLAGGEQLRRIPYKTRWTWAEKAVLLLDINSATFPFRQDFFRLRSQLLNLRGSNGLQLQYIVDEPGGLVERDDGERSAPTAWRTPDSDTPLLILSDLGSLPSTRRSLNQWLAFGHQLRREGQRPVVLMPVAPRQLDRRLLRSFCCVVWDQTGTLRPVTGAAQPETMQEDKQAPIDDLLALHFPVVRANMVLTRSLRRLFPATLLDVGHEGAIWHHAAVKGVGDEWGWRPEQREHSLDRFRELCQTLSRQQQCKLVDLIGRHHGQLPDELYFEAMDRLIQFGLPVPEEVQRATKQFFATLVKTYHAQPDHLGLDLWVKRCLARNDQEAVYGNHDHLIACMALERLRRQTNHEQIQWPACIPPEKLLPFINQPRAARNYCLRQWGQLLELSPEMLLGSPASNWSQGAALLTCTLTDSTILFRHRMKDGQYQQISLKVPEKGTLFHQLPPGAGHQLHLGGHWLTLEALGTGEKFDWAPFKGIEKDSMWVETVDGQDRRFRWYWNPPELHHDQTWRGFWYSQRLPENDSLPVPQWAEDCQRDEYGLRVRGILSGVVQWFRWIEPGSFLMGSPEDEPQRFKGEDQHQVRLSQGFWLAETAVNQALWTAVMDKNPSRFEEDPENPVERVSWLDVQTFIERLNDQAPGLAFRLPTEAEWEYACRSGSNGPFSWGAELSPEQANYNGEYPYNYQGKQVRYRQQTVAVRSFAPNFWGLYQMHGNVCEWCADLYAVYPAGPLTDPQGPKTGDDRVVRGGSWNDLGGFVRSAIRYWFEPSFRVDSLGFRLARGH